VHLSSGDVVDVVDSESPEGVVARGAVVFDVAELGVQGQRLVSLLLDSDTAAAVARVPAGAGLLVARHVRKLAPRRREIRAVGRRI
jgi:hypothetical protein